jgi:hypothetical protein
MKYKVMTQQPANIVQEFFIEADSENEAKERTESLIKNGELPEPLYTATETCGLPEVFSVEIE